MNANSLRPKGTVEVPCSMCDQNVCRVCCPEPPEGVTYFWVDSLDPRLPDGPFVCDLCSKGTVSHYVCGRSIVESEGGDWRRRCECPQSCDHVGLTPSKGEDK